MKKTVVDDVRLSEHVLVTVTEMNHLVELQHMAKVNRDCHIKKLDAERYMEIETGEIKEFERTENRSQGLNSLRQTFKKLRYLINANFTGATNELFVTLTYAEQTNDHLQVGKDYDKFLKRLRYEYGSVDAIKVLEPHASGNWHMHVLFRFNAMRNVYIPNDTLAKIWGLGYVKIQSLKNVDNIGAYVSAYLTDIEVTSENILGFAAAGKEHDIKQVDDKIFVKGGRLPFYKSGVNIFSKTKGIKYPERIEMTYAEAKKIVGAATPHYKKSIAISDEEKDFSNVITYEQYNLKRD